MPTSSQNMLTLGLYKLSGRKAQESDAVWAVLAAMICQDCAEHRIPWIKWWEE